MSGRGDLEAFKTVTSRSQDNRIFLLSHLYPPPPSPPPAPPQAPSSPPPPRPRLSVSYVVMRLTQNLSFCRPTPDLAMACSYEYSRGRSRKVTEIESEVWFCIGVLLRELGHGGGSRDPTNVNSTSRAIT